MAAILNATDGIYHSGVVGYGIYGIYGLWPRGI